MEHPDQSGQVDPHEFRYPFVTPYNAMFNNPLSIVDPTGMDGDSTKSREQTNEKSNIPLNTVSVLPLVVSTSSTGVGAWIGGVILVGAMATDIYLLMISDAAKSVNNDSATDKEGDSPGTENGSSDTNDDLVNKLILTSDPGRETKGRTKQLERDETMDDANKTFDSLNLENVKEKGDGVRVGETDQGRIITVTPLSQPSIHIRKPGSENVTKIRYIKGQ